MESGKKSPKGVGYGAGMTQGKKKKSNEKRNERKKRSDCIPTAPNQPRADERHEKKQSYVAGWLPQWSGGAVPPQQPCCRERVDARHPGVLPSFLCEGERLGSPPCLFSPNLAACFLVGPTCMPLTVWCSPSLPLFRPVSFFRALACFLVFISDQAAPGGAGADGARSSGVS